MKKKSDTGLREALKHSIKKARAERDAPASRLSLASEHALRKPPYKFYWAYGSNLCKRAMWDRCPLARPYGQLVVADGLLVFRGVADVIHNPGTSVAGALWQITPACERALDRFEGVAFKLYSKKYMRIRTRGEEHPVLYYKMNERGIMPPNEFYLDTIIQGYRDFDLDMSLLNEAVLRSHTDKAVNDYLQERHERRGRKMVRPDYVGKRTGLDFNTPVTIVTDAPCNGSKH